jgi:23S rRNA (cytosine1962-C5)-methyltransferase
MAAAAIAVVSARGAGRIRAGHPWVLRADVARGPATDAGDGGPALVTVEDGRGRVLGLATWAAQARIALRMLARATDPTPPPAGAPLAAIVADRLDQALARRAAMNLDRDAYRVSHAESDGLPGLIVDRYADAAVLQTTSVAMNAARAEIAEIVRAKLQARLVIARDDGSARDVEGLPRFAGVVAGGGDSRVVYRLGANRLEADLLTDGKTGGFLDQADNHAALAALAAPLLARPGTRALDAFTYHGGFALALARAAARDADVLALDENPAAVERASANGRRNGLANLRVEHANAFDRLRELESRREGFDVVVLDPPALAKRGGSGAIARAQPGFARRGPSREGAGTLPGFPHLQDAAARAYKELVLRGARLTRAGGLLVACSCSGRVGRAQWDEICADALADAGRAAHVLVRAGAGRDHPELAGVPETGHLKVWTFRML